MRPFLVGQELLPASAEEPARADVVKAQQYIRAADVLTLCIHYGGCRCLQEASQLKISEKTAKLHPPNSFVQRAMRGQYSSSVSFPMNKPR
jgi:hypothetical protein